MAFDKYLFIEDIKGLNGVRAQEAAMEKLLKAIDRDFTPFEIYELDEELEEVKATCTVLQAENNDLRLENLSLKTANGLLRLENRSVGDLLDELVVGNRETFEYGESVN